MRPAEGRKEVVERHLIGDVGQSESERDLSAGLRMKYIVGAESEVENAAGVHSARVVIVIGHGGRRKRQHRRSESSTAVSQRTLNARWHAVAGQADRELL